MSKKSALHKRSVSSFNDIEKGHQVEYDEYVDDSSDEEKFHKPRMFGRTDFLLVVLIILTMGTVLNLVIISNVAGVNGGGEKSLIKSILSYFEKNFTFGTNGLVDNDLNNILNVDNIDNKNLNEWEKFVDELNQGENGGEGLEEADGTASVEELSKEYAKIQNEMKNDINHLNNHRINNILNDEKIPDNYHKTHHQSNENLDSLDDESSFEDSNPQLDLAEILSINSIVLLINDENLMKQERVKQILYSLNINPELKIVDIKKHPNYKNILNYLKNFNSFNTEHEALSKNIQIDYDLDDIPRLFISGLPVAGYADIITKYDDERLVKYLKAVGEGSIKMEI